MKALIFGISGQDGFYLTQLLKSKQIEIIGISRSSGNWIQGDITNYQLVSEVIKVHQPDFVFHLAANSTTKHEALFENHETISTGTLHILESVRLHSPSSKIFLSGSAMQFKNEGIPINENTPLEASSPYSIARIQSVYAGRYYREKLGMHVYTGYLFNHESPYRRETHLSMMIVNAAKQIAAGNKGRIAIGDLTVKKEWCFAGDTVQGIFDLVNQDHVFEACIGTGLTHTVQDWLQECFGIINKDWRDFVEGNPDFVPEYGTLVSDPALIHSIGWKPKFSFQELVQLMMN